jgi:nucleotide-binding universal stress UspA family protein
VTPPSGTPKAGLAAVAANVDRLTGVTPGKGTPVRVPEFRHLLVALDGSAPSQLALEWAIGLATGLRARVSLVSVAPPPGLAAWPGDPVAASAAVLAMFEEFEEQAEAVLDRARRSVEAAGLRCKAHLRRGSPATEVARAAKELGADLLLLGSHGHGALERATRLGSVAESVKHHAPCSVLIARTPFPAGHVVMGTDGSRPSKAAVAVGLRLADRMGAGATVVHAFDLLYGFAHMGPPAQDKRLEEALNPGRRSFTEGAQYRFRIGNASATLVEVARKGHAGLIIVGSRGLGSVRGRLLGSVSDRVTRHAEASVLVVKPAR